MTPALPKPIAAYVEANARLDVDGMLKPFTTDAILLDNGTRHEGHAELRALLEHAVIPVKAIFTPDSVRHEDGRVVVEGPAHGDFPGSPIRFTYRFTLENDSCQVTSSKGPAGALVRARVILVYCSSASLRNDAIKALEITA